MATFTGCDVCAIIGAQILTTTRSRHGPSRLWSVGHWRRGVHHRLRRCCRWLVRRILLLLRLLRLARIRRRRAVGVLLRLLRLRLLDALAPRDDHVGVGAGAPSGATERSAGALLTTRATAAGWGGDHLVVLNGCLRPLKRCRIL